MKLAKLLVLTIVAGLLTVLAIANRHSVTFVLDPFSKNNQALSIDMPFFAFIFAALLTGLVLGGFVTWMKQGKWRKKVRQRTREAHEWRGQAEQLKHQLNTSRQQSLPSATMSQ